MIVVLQYLYAFALFGGVIFVFLRLFVWAVRFCRHAYEVANRFGPRR